MRYKKSPVKKTVSLLLVVAMVMGIFAGMGRPAGAADTVTLDLGNGDIDIDPNGYKQGDDYHDFTGSYIITGSRTSDTPLDIVNNTGKRAVFNIAFDNVTIKGEQYCTAVRISGNSHIDWNLEYTGNNLIAGESWPAFMSKMDDNKHVNIYMKDNPGGSIELTRQTWKNPPNYTWYQAEMGTAGLYIDGILHDENGNDKHELISGVSIAEPEHKVYGDELDVNAQVTDGDNIQHYAGPVIYYKADEDGNADGEELPDAPVNAGRYRAELKFGKDVVYKAYTIARAPALELETAQRPTGKNNMVYTGELIELVNAPEEKLPDDYKMKYAVTSNEIPPAPEQYVDVFPVKAEAGHYYVWYKAVRDDNYEDTEPVCIEAEIKKAVPEYTVPTGLTAVYGQKLADISLPDGWAWKDDTLNVGNVGKQQADAVFTPDDDRNYENVSLKLNITVKSAPTAVPTKEPTAKPTEVPTKAPTVVPTKEPTAIPTKTPTATPTPTAISTVVPTTNPTTAPTAIPTVAPSVTPTKAPNTSAKKLKAMKKQAKLIMNEGIVVNWKNKGLDIKWNKVKVADGYDIYVQYCSKKIFKVEKNIKNNSITNVSLKGINGRKFDNTDELRTYVSAYKIINGRKIVLADSIDAHVAGKDNAKYTNVKALVSVKKKYIVKAGKPININAKVVLSDKKKKHLTKEHGAMFRYRTSDSRIVSIDNAKGKVKGLKAGTCTLYVYSINGITKKTAITVKK